jgi:hypothetical protein
MRLLRKNIKRNANERLQHNSEQNPGRYTCLVSTVRRDGNCPREKQAIP